MSGIILNEDCTNFFMLRSEEEVMSNLTELTEHYCRGDVKEIMLNTGANVTSYASNVRERCWENVEFRGERIFFQNREIALAEQPTIYRWLKHTKMLADAGIDPYAIWIADIRKRGRSPWISLRCNDAHNTPDLDHPLHSKFWREHPELWRVTYRTMESLWAERAYDFAHPVIQQNLLAWVGETLTRYDLDGIEMDWMRFGYHFRPGFEPEGREILTAMHRSIRQMADEAAKRLGHPVKVSARVPGRPEDAFELGYDPVRWVREKLVDILTPCPFFSSTDTAIPVAFWREILGDEVILAPGIEVLVRPTNYEKIIRTTNAIAMGQATNFLSQGADRIYLFNFFDRYEYQRSNMESLAEVLDNAGTLEKCAAHARRHCITYPDTRAPGNPEGNRLPVTVNKFPSESMRFAIGPAPGKERKAYVILGFEQTHYNQMKLFLNGVQLQETAEFPDDQNTRVFPMRRAWLADGTAKNGDNLVEVHNLDKEPFVVRWAEIQIL